MAARQAAQSTGGRASTLTHATVLRLGDTRALDQPQLAGAPRVIEISLPDALHAQLERRFDLVVVSLVLVDDEGLRRAILHTAMQHLDRDGHLVVLHEANRPDLCHGFSDDDLHVVGTRVANGTQISEYRRGDRITVHDLLFEARSTIRRLTPQWLFEMMRSSAPPLLVDTRTPVDRGRFGVIPGSVHIPRTVLEWHLDPSNGYLHPAMQSLQDLVVVVCNGGYSSSLAAANLKRLGFEDVADLVGGHTAWCAAGLPVQKPDHSHLDMPVCNVAFNPER